MAFNWDEARPGFSLSLPSTIGKLLPNALYIHREALDSLEPLLRVFEGCARAYLGEVEGANLIKLHRHSGKVSYLVYPDFETDPHPALLRSIKLSLRTRELDCFDYATSTNPPILHRKETFLPPGHELVAKFARLTQQEEKHGLLDETATIGTRRGGSGGWRSAGSRFVGIGWCGEGMKKAKRGNHEIDEIHVRKTMRRHGAKNADYRGGVTCLYDTQLLAPACMHPSPVAALALRPSGACQTYQSPPQPPGPRRGGRLSALSAQPLSTGGCGHVCLRALKQPRPMVYSK